jgi:hypothetical protein
MQPKKEAGIDACFCYYGEIRPILNAAYFAEDALPFLSFPPRHCKLHTAN